MLLDNITTYKKQTFGDIKCIKEKSQESVKSQVRIKVKIKEFMNRGLSSKDIHKHYDIQ